MLIHVGLHKTGTSYLQKHIFPDASLGFRAVAGHAEVVSRVILCNPFGDVASDIRLAFGPRIDAAIRDGLCPVISCEKLSGSPASGGFWWSEGARRLLAAFPDARLVITIREQYSMIASIYKHLVRARLCASIGQFLDQSPLDRGFSPICHRAYYEYHWMIRECQAMAGDPSRVIVLPFEWLREDPVRFVRPLLGQHVPEKFDLPREAVNPGFSAVACEVRRRSNRLFVNPSDAGKSSGIARLANALCWHLNRWVPRRLAARSDRRLLEQIKTLVGDHYARSNAETRRLTGLDLASLGYVVSPCAPDTTA